MYLSDNFAFCQMSQTDLVNTDLGVLQRFLLMMGVSIGSGDGLVLSGKLGNKPLLEPVKMMPL